MLNSANTTLRRAFEKTKNEKSMKKFFSKYHKKIYVSQCDVNVRLSYIESEIDLESESNLEKDIEIEKESESRVRICEKNKMKFKHKNKIFIF